MLILLAALVALGIVAAVATKLLMMQEENAADAVVKGSNDCGTCSGDNDKCEQVCMMEASLKAVEYYDDEELDAYRGRRSDSYTDEEAERFREVLYTMRQDEVKGWSRSLVLRGVSLPDQLKDEVVMLIGE